MEEKLFDAKLEIIKERIDGWEAKFSLQVLH